MRADEQAFLSAGLETLFQTEHGIGLALLDRDLRYVRINRTLADFNGVPVSDALGRTVAEVLPKAYAQLRPLLLSVLNEGASLKDFRVQVEVPSNPGEPSEWAASYLPIRDAQGLVVGVLVQAANVTLTRKAEAALRDSEARVRRVLDSLYVFVGVLSPDGLLLEANRSPLEAAGISLESVQGRLVWDTHWWSHDPVQQQWLREAVKRAAAGGVVRQDVVVRMAGDSLMTVDFMIAPLRNAEGEITHLIPSGIDISNRVASERALRASEARFRSAFDAAPVGMALVDGQGVLRLVNRTLGELFTEEASEMVGLPVSTFIPPEDRQAHEHHVQNFLAAPSMRLMSRRGNLQALRKDQSRFCVEVGLNPISGSEPIEVLVTVADIDERMAAQAQIERALQEKTVLLHEVHHRVKNNLQIIASLLRLQSLNAGEAAKAVLRESKSRVKAMALMHQLLYERNDFSTLELGPYLQRMSALLSDAYLGPGSAIQIRVDAPSEGLKIDMQQAIPCGLIVNELVTNALKHAFADGQPGTIRVLAAELKPGLLRVEVSDDGVGLPAGLDMPSCHTLGFQLIPLLADQLGARVTWHTELGTRCRLEFQSEEGLEP